MAPVALHRFLQSCPIRRTGNDGKRRETTGNDRKRSDGWMDGWINRLGIRAGKTRLPDDVSVDRGEEPGALVAIHRLAVSHPPRPDPCDFIISIAIFHYFSLLRLMSPRMRGGRGGSAGLIAKVTSPLGTPICAHMQMSWQGRGSRWHICKCRLAGLLC